MLAALYTASDGERKAIVCTCSYPPGLQEDSRLWGYNPTTQTLVGLASLIWAPRPASSLLSARADSPWVERALPLLDNNRNSMQSSLPTHPCSQPSCTLLRIRPFKKLPCTIRIILLYK